MEQGLNRFAFVVVAIMTGSEKYPLGQSRGLNWVGVQMSDTHHMSFQSALLILSAGRTLRAFAHIGRACPPISAHCCTYSPASYPVSVCVHRFGCGGDGCQGGRLIRTCGPLPYGPFGLSPTSGVRVRPISAHCCAYPQAVSCLCLCSPLRLWR